MEANIPVAGDRFRKLPLPQKTTREPKEVSENRNSRLLECGRLQVVEASGCRLARLDLREGVQARYQARCKGRLQWSIYGGEVCYLAGVTPIGVKAFVAVVYLRWRGVLLINDVTSNISENRCSGRSSPSRCAAFWCAHTTQHHTRRGSPRMGL